MEITNNELPLSWRIQRSYQQIASLKEFKMNEATMALFSELMTLVSNDHQPDVIRNIVNENYFKAICNPMQRLFAQAAYFYELHWAQKIINANNPKKVLEQDYPYLDHYQRACTLEQQALTAHAKQPLKRVLMIGSGPLPMTSILLARQGIQVDNLDIKDEANRFATQLCEELNPSTSMRFITSNVLDYNAIHDYDAIWLAAMAGGHQLKPRILDHLYQNMQSGTLLLARTACNLRVMLYPEITAEDLKAFKLRLLMQTFTDNFHSIYVAER